MKTTLKKIKEHNPCSGGWQKLLSHLHKTKAADEPLSILTILDSNGVEDAIWALRAVDGYDKEIRLFAVWCARRVQHLMKDERSIKAIDVAEAYANGKATKEELAAALDAAWDAALDAESDAAWDAARAAAWDATLDAESDAAWDAARAAAWAAESDAESDAAGDAERAAQEQEFRRMLNEIEYAQQQTL